MEGVIQYRLLGSHPAASGRYLTLGFTGETTTLSRVLEQLIREHQINTARYKLDVVRLVNTNTAGGLPSEQPLHSEDRIFTYDRLAITISQRQLSDELRSAAAAAQAEQARRLRETERQLVGDRAAALEGSARMASSSNARRDPHELERVAAVATRVFPVRPGQTCQETGREAERGARCVLCELVAFDAVRTPCCHFLVCRLCLQSAQAIVADTAEQCPVCGRGVRVSSPPERGGALKEEEEEDNDDDGGVEEGVGERKGGRGRGSGAGRNVKPPFVMAEGLLVQETKPITRAGGQRIGTKTRREDNNNSNNNTSSSSTARLTPEMMACERNLVEGLDQILAMLDMPDPLSSEVKARRVRSAALKALDEHSV